MKITDSQDKPVDLVDIPPAHDEAPSTLPARSTPPTKPRSLGISADERLRTASTSTQLTLIVGLTIFVALISFGAGIHYQKERTASQSGFPTNMQMRQFGPGGGRYRGSPPRGINQNNSTNGQGSSTDGTDNDTTAPASNI